MLALASAPVLPALKWDLAWGGSLSGLRDLAGHLHDGVPNSYATRIKQQSPVVP